jgi:hypothetical protein
MVTATQSNTTETYNRPWLLQWQGRNLLRRTTDISPERLKKICDTGIANQWLCKVAVYGFDQSNRCHVGIALEINWLTHTIELVFWGDEVTVNKTKYTDDVAPEVDNAVEVFNQAANAECLRPEWRVFYTEGVDAERVDRELGLQDGPPITWAGKIREQYSRIAELPKMKVIVQMAESDAPESVESLFS